MTTKTNMPHTADLIDRAMTYVNIIGEDGTGYMAAVHQALTDPASIYIGPTHDTKAEWEICLDHSEAPVAVMIRKYRNGTMRITFASSYDCMSRATAEARIAEYLAEKAAKAEAVRTRQAEADDAFERTGIVNLNALVRFGLPTSSCTSYDEWDLMRRELFKAHDGDAAIEGVEVDHNEYDTVVYLKQPELGGQVVASWCCATGTCRIKAPREAALEIAGAIGNLISNSLQYGWGDVQS